MLTDMKQDPYEPVGPSGAENPYPYGLCLHFTHEMLEKLNITELPRAGQEYHIMAVGKVTRVEASIEDEPEAEGCMDLQIMMIELAPEAPHPGEENETAADEMKEKVVGGKVSVPKSMQTALSKNY